MRLETGPRTQAQPTPRLQKLEGGAGSLGAGVTGGCESLLRKQACLRDDMGLQSQHLEVTDKKDFRPSPPLSVGGCLPHFHELSAPQYDPAAIAHEQQTPATSVFGDVPDTLSEVSRPSVSD
ncbi:hypothetical protein LEMLEM_LOCUS20664 [Lemmus lemmus]